MELEVYYEWLDDLNTEFGQLVEKKKELLRTYASSECPFAVGDILKVMLNRKAAEVKIVEIDAYIDSISNQQKLRWRMYCTPIKTLKGKALNKKIFITQNDWEARFDNGEPTIERSET